MILVENELNRKNIDLANNDPEFIRRQEREQKYRVTKPEVFEPFRAEAMPIEQVYLSQPDEEFSVRVRRKTTPNGDVYTATLKDVGSVENGFRKRLEVETEISKKAYDLYANNPSFVRVRKSRTHISDELTVDFVEGLEHPIVELETNDPLMTQSVLEAFGDALEDCTDSFELDNGYIAQRLSGQEFEAPDRSLEKFASRVVKDMVATYSLGGNQVVVGLSGMSGSGKSTVTESIQDQIVTMFGEEYRPIVLSTDDYHRGKAWLEETYGAPWTEWDDPRVYNTELLADDLRLLREGIPLQRRHFDFDLEEVVYDDEVQPAPFVILEGLYAGSNDLRGVRDLHFNLPTGLATSVGRDVRRIVIEGRANRAFPDPESRLKYQIESALPMYLSQERPTRNVHGAYLHVMAERAFMLEKLKSVA